jgi:hypothetical protein
MDLKCCVSHGIDIPSVKHLHFTSGLLLFSRFHVTREDVTTSGQTTSHRSRLKSIPGIVLCEA